MIKIRAAREITISARYIMCASMVRSRFGYLWIITSMERSLVCYRFYPWTTDYDVELIWELVHRHWGQIHLGRDSIDFYIPCEYETVLVLAYPELVRERELDYVKQYYFSRQ